jgi:hypothetical protein
MYLEYLTDRIGGPGVFQAIELGKPNAWSNPAVVRRSATSSSWPGPGRSRAATTR